MFDDALSAARETELMSEVAGTLNKVCILQLTSAVGTLEDLGAVITVTASISVPVAGA